MKTVFTFLAILFLSISMTASVYGNLYPNKGAWVEGEITNPFGETSYLGGYGTQTLMGEAFGTGDAQSYILPSIGKTGLFTKSDDPGPQGTYVKALSRYYETFTFYPSTILPTKIYLNVGMSYQFLSPSGGIFEGYPKGGQAGFRILLNPDSVPSWKYEVVHSEDHTTGGWDLPPGSTGIYGADLGYWLYRYCGLGRSDGKFVFGVQVTLVFEYYTWARNGATVNSLHTSDFKFLLPDDVKNAGGYLEVTSPNGYYQLDGVKRVKIIGALELLLLD
jgi:hypothetical protein